jgi:hypothetical protein
MDFYGRKTELELLGRLWRKRSASFVVCHGRRRIGKSTLIEEFAARSGCRFLEIEGLVPDARMTDQRQREHFAGRLADLADIPLPRADTWPQAFDALLKVIRRPAAPRTLVFLDEISWMGAYDPAFAAFLKNAWDTGFSKCDGLVFVVCGSVSAWIAENILKSRGFAGRVSLDLRVGELPLADCVPFWGAAAEKTAPAEMLDLLSVTGGIPRYLREINPSLSAAGNILNLAFLPEGVLFDDFDVLFTDAFSRAPDARRAVLEALADGPLLPDEIAAAAHTVRNGHLTVLLEELREAGFVSRDEGLNPDTGKPLRQTRWRLCDNYARFYLKCVAPRAAAIRQGLFRLSAPEQLPGWDATLGLQFELLVANHLAEFAPRLGLGRALAISAAPYFRKPTKTRPGVQIDLLLQTRKSLCVIEIKRRKRIGEEIETEVRRKVEALALPRGASVRTALVYSGHLAPAVEENGWFDFLLPAESLLR